MTETDERVQDAEQPPSEGPQASSARRQTAIVVAVVVLFAAVALAKPLLSRVDPKTVPGRTTLTSARNDAMADYQAAVASGKPIYVLFHSLT